MSRLEVAASKGGLAVISSFIIYMLGTFNEVVVVLIFFMCLDFLTGLFRSWVTKSWNSTLGVTGIMKKVSILILIGMTAGIEYALIHAGQSPNGLVLLTVTCFFIVNEGLSIMENCAQIGIPIPPILYNALEKLHRNPEEKDQQVPRNAYLKEEDRKDWEKEFQANKKKKKP